MPYLKKAAFTSGEIDPSLHDRTDLKTYFSGLKTARNLTIGKNGRIINTAGTWLLGATKQNDVNTRIYIPDFQNYVFEFGVGYLRAWDLSDLENQNYKPTTFADEVVTDYTLAELPTLQFTTVIQTDLVAGGNPELYYVFVACKGKPLRAYTFNGVISYFHGVPELSAFDYPALDEGTGTPAAPPIAFPTPANSVVVEYVGIPRATMLARTGHPVEYGITVVTKAGIESPVYRITKYRADNINIEDPYMRLPTGNELTGFYITNLRQLVNVDYYGDQIKYFKVYRKPYLSGIYGLIGEIGNDANLDFQGLTAFTLGYTDFGQEADYTNPPPELSENYGNVLDPLSGGTYLGPAGITNYSSRLIIWKNDYLFASKINNPNYFLRDFPLTTTTSFNLKIGTSGPDIRYCLDANGLIVFTSEGIWYGGYDGPISSVNPLLRKTGEWIIDSNVPPILTPYGVLFVDSATNTVKTLFYDDNNRTMKAEDVSIFSDHLFYGKRVKSWAYHNGDNPFLFVVLNDGTAVSLSYNDKQQLIAWTRHDSDGEYESVISYREVSTGENYLMFVINRNGNRLIETSSKRIKKDLYTSRTFAHSATKFQIVEVVPPILTLLDVGGEWDVEVQATALIGAYYDTRIGQTFAIYNAEKDNYFYMKLTNVVPLTSVTFQIINEALPVNLRNTPVELIECHTVVTGLGHLEGKDVSIVADGAIIASPNNDIEGLPTYTVTGGQITLDEPKAYSIVGLPYTSDLETLELDSADGSLSLEPKIVNEVTVRYTRSRGGYISGKFPDNDKVAGMEDAESWNRFDDINKPLVEKIVTRSYRNYSDWNLKGKIVFRQVDPLPVEIVSLILDVSRG